VKRGDDPRLLTGRGRYVDDGTVPRMVHAAFVRSAHAHARLTRVNLDRAGRAPGVVGVLAGDAVARLCKPYRGVLLHYKGMKTGAMLPLAVEYEPLPAVLAPEAALAADAPVIHPELGDNILYETRLAAGDVERALARAGRVWTRDARAHGLDLDPGSSHDASRARRALQPPRASRSGHRPRRRRKLRHQDPRLSGRHGDLRAGADARPPGQVRREQAPVVFIRHPRARASASRSRPTATAS
jgi:carbon-monoxide dehydrogenase large subunit